MPRPMRRRVFCAVKLSRYKGRDSMKIQDASVTLASRHELRQEQLREESLRLWTGGNERQETAARGQGGDRALSVRISEEALHLRQQAEQSDFSPVEGGEGEVQSEDPKLTTIRLILEALTGRKIRIMHYAPAAKETSASIASEEGTESAAPGRQGWGFAYDLLERTSEEERLQFTAQGQVRTADGRTLDFQLDLVVERQFVEENRIRIREGDAKLVDPLVINFTGKAAALTDLRFAFDLDADGREEQISSLAPGSGFLAIDRNGDGIINNGLELFGPASGNGFTELARLDADRNGWLDENDPHYADLRVWMKDAAGKDQLYTLREKNVGAIFLQPAQTPFSLKSGDNVLLGRFRESSIFLEENGRPGTVQEVDLAV